jgi:hypothetical protein
MSRLNPEKLSVEFREGVTATEPIIPRRYTLTHSDITAKLFLTIGLTYAYDKTNAMRDEVLGEWIKTKDQYFYYVYLYVDGEFGAGVIAIRNYIFTRELPLALEAIRYGDSKFFSAHPELNYSPIIVYFMSTNPEFNRVENWGTFSDYEISRYYSVPQTNPFGQNKYLLDIKIGDVNGDGVPDKVSLYGNKPDGTAGIFADNIIVVIEDGRTNQTKTISPEFNSGYNARLFLGDFTMDRVDDIKVSIDSGGSGGYGYFYLYSFKNNNLKEIFNFDQYNDKYKYKVDYSNLYKVDVGNVMLDKLFTLDISYKGYDYLSQYYDENGKLNKPVQGEVLALSSLVSIVNNEKNDAYDLLAFQRIIGIYNSDTLGFIENLLSWDGQKFVSSRMFATIPGTNLISPYQP